MLSANSTGIVANMRRIRNRSIGSRQRSRTAASRRAKARPSPKLERLRPIAPRFRAI
jgi:hypothetical protein